MENRKLNDQELEKVVGGTEDTQNTGSRGNGVILVTAELSNAEEHNVIAGSAMDKYELVL